MLTPPAAAEALLFAEGGPIEKKRLAALLGVKPAELSVALTALSEQLSGRGLSLVDTGDEVELRTSADAAELIKKLRESELSRDLGKASLETLAVIAYRDGATRSEVDWVRGVNSSASVRTLLMRGLIEGSEDPRDRRRVRYALTTDALGHLGISGTGALPRREELSQGASAAVAQAEAAENEA